MQALTRHPFCAKVPEMSDHEYELLAADIKARGQLDDIDIYKNQILDGWHRYSILCDLGITPRCKVFHGNDRDAVNLVKSRMKGRGESLTVSQIVMVEVELDAMLGRASAEARCTVADISESTGGSRATVARAKKVQRDAAPEVVEAVKAGAVSVNDAHAVADLPHERQAAAVAAKANGAARTLREAAGVADNGHGNGKHSPPTVDRLDAIFVTIPEKALPAFVVADEIADVCRGIDQLATKIGKLQASVGGAMIHGSIVQNLQGARKTLWAARPTHVCPYCGGKGGACDPCKGEAWTTATFFAAAPPEKRKAMEKKGAVNVPI